MAVVPWLGRTRFAGALLHPLLISSLAGLLAGDLAIGWIAGLALAPWSEVLGRGRPSTAAAVGGALAGSSGVLLAWQSLLGGFLVEAFAGGVIGVVAALALSPLEDRVVNPSIARTALGLVLATAILWLAWAFLVTWPEFVRAVGPWLSGALMVLGLGALCGRRDPSAGSEGRAAGGLLVLLVGNFTGQLGLLMLPVLLGVERLRKGRWVARAATVLLALALCWVMAWFPYQLPSQETPLIPGLPGTQSPIGPIARWTLLPLMFGAGLGASLARRPLLGLVAIPLLTPLLMSGL